MKRIVATVKASVLAFLLPKESHPGTQAETLPEELTQTEADLRYAMRLLWHAHQTLSEVDLMDPDSFTIEQALQYLRLAPQYLAGPWAEVEREIAENAKRGTKQLKEENHVG